MSYSDFLEALPEIFEKILMTSSSQENFERKHRYIIQCRERGKARLKIFQRHLIKQLEELKILDVGCAYGGTAIEMQLVGAQVTGVEVSKTWLELARLNMKNETNLDLINCDASSRQLSNLAYGNKYDFIVLDDVFEHIYDTVGLMENLKHLSSGDTTIFFEIPNGYFPGNIEKEIHQGRFGLSILTPDLWREQGAQHGFSIFYRPWQYYQCIFGNYSFRTFSLLNSRVKDSRNQLIEKIDEDIKNIESIACENPNYKHPMLLNCLEKYRHDFEWDRLNLDTYNLNWKYYTQVWRGFVSRSPDTLRNTPFKFTINKLSPKNLIFQAEQKEQPKINLHNSLEILNALEDSLKYEIDMPKDLNELIGHLRKRLNNLETSYRKYISLKNSNFVRMVSRINYPFETGRSVLNCLRKIL